MPDASAKVLAVANLREFFKDELHGRDLPALVVFDTRVFSSAGSYNRCER